MNEDTLCRLVIRDEFDNEVDPVTPQWTPSLDTALLRMVGATGVRLEAFAAERQKENMSLSPYHMWTLYRYYQRRVQETVNGDRLQLFCSWTFRIEESDTDSAYQKHLTEKGYQL